MTEDHRTEFKILICIISGIAVASFLYLIYKDWKNEQYKLSNLKSLETKLLNNNDLLSIQPLNEETDNIQSLLINQETLISNQQEQISDIIKLLKGIQNNEKPTIPKPTLQPTIAASVMSLKPSIQDKMRQSKFGLL